MRDEGPGTSKTRFPNPQSAIRKPQSFQPRWSHLVQDLPDWNRRAPRAPISFAYGQPDTPSFPSQELAATTDLVLREHSDRALQYGSGAGLPRLIEALG